MAQSKIYTILPSDGGAFVLVKENGHWYNELPEVDPLPQGEVERIAAEYERRGYRREVI